MASWSYEEDCPFCDGVRSVWGRGRQSEAMCLECGACESTEVRWMSLDEVNDYRRDFNECHELTPGSSEHLEQLTELAKRHNDLDATEGGMLMMFASDVLAILRAESDWSADTLDAIAQRAVAYGFPVHTEPAAVEEAKEVSRDARD